VVVVEEEEGLDITMVVGVVGIILVAGAITAEGA